MKQNVLIISTDEQRWDTLGCMGHPVVKTPNLDRLAASSLRFEEAFCCSPLCVPSRVGFYTGQAVSTTRAFDNAMASHIDANQWSYIKAFHEQGYRIGLAGKNHNFDDACLDAYFCFREEYGHFGKTAGTFTETDRDICTFRMNEQRPTHQTPSGILMEGLIEEPEPFAEEDCMTWRIFEDGKRFLDTHGDEPFLLHYSFPDPHWPQVACEPYHSMYWDHLDDIVLDGSEVDWATHPFAHYVQSQSSGFDTYTNEERKKILATYYGQITFVDKAVGALLDHLDALNLTDSTLVVFMSDHGDLAGRYGLISKTKCFYDPVVRIPLMMRVPGMNTGGASTAAHVSNIDVMPTIAELLGIPSPKEVQGRSFAPVLKDPERSHRERIFAEVGSLGSPPPPVSFEDYPEVNRKKTAQHGCFWFCEYTAQGRSAMIRTPTWKYCFYTGDMEELYDLKADPLELNNLAQDPELASRKDALKSELMTWLLNPNVDPFPSSNKERS